MAINSKDYDFIALVGPTGIGKSRIAFKLAMKLYGKLEIVCMDSCQIYKYAIIGTDSPSNNEKRKVSHHLYNFLLPSVELSAGEYVERVIKVIREIKKNGRMPLLVGGTGFFLSALLDGFHKIPKIDGDIRRRVKRIIEGFGVERAFKLLKYSDPLIANTIDRNNPSRISRALEIIFQTKMRIVDIRNSDRVNYGLKGLVFGLYLPLKELENRIYQRTEDMINRGFILEVRKLIERGYNLDDPVFKAIGYKYVYYYLVGGLSMSEMIKSIIKDTKAYAKRQLTWFLKDKRVWWLPVMMDIERADKEYVSFYTDIIMRLFKRFVKF
ncbi:MAG: tRNA (adenosine(37)-N6)-dimethylallyltransferase MiaA [bacterium]